MKNYKKGEILTLTENVQWYSSRTAVTMIMINYFQEKN